MGPSAFRKCLVKVNLAVRGHSSFVFPLCHQKGAWLYTLTGFLDHWRWQDIEDRVERRKGQLSHFALLLQMKQAYFVRDYFYSALLKSFLHCLNLTGFLGLHWLLFATDVHSVLLRNGVGRGGGKSTLSKEKNKTTIFPRQAVPCHHLGKAAYIFPDHLLTSLRKWIPKFSEY